MNYRQLVTQHLQTLTDRGLTQREVAKLLGFTNGNYISMLMNPHGTDVLALKRLPALAHACGLADRDALRLPLLLARDHPRHQSTLDLATVRWLLALTVRVRDAAVATRVAAGVLA